MASIAYTLTRRGEPLRNWGTQIAWSVEQVRRVLVRGERLRTERVAAGAG